MKIEITPEVVTALGKELSSLWVANLTVDEILTRFEPKELASRMKPADRLAGLSLSDRLAGMNLSDRFVDVEPEEIEDYLKQLKRQQD